MAVKITDLPAESAPTADDLIILRDNATGTTKKITVETLLLAFNYLYSPTGAITQYAGSSAPSGWLICDGSPIDRTDFAALFAIVGSTYGNGNGVDTFNIPDMRGKVAVGKAASGTFAALNASGGEEQHTQTVAELAQHSHGVNDPGHAHGVADPGHTHRIAAFGTSGSYGLVDSQHASSSGANVQTGASGTGIGIFGSGTGIFLSVTGSNQAFNVLQPYRVLNYIIKT